MKPDLVTFDCADTLVQMNWRLGPFALESAGEAGFDVASLDFQPTSDRYELLFQARLADYWDTNRRSADAVRGFWVELNTTWLEELGLDPTQAAAIYQASEELLFGPDSTYFPPFPDVQPCLERLRAADIRLAVVSNWDVSLHRLLARHGWTDLFDVVLPSLQFGCEKPDPRIFQAALSKVGISEPGLALHVGDDPIDDLGGARSAGMRAVLIDRSRPDSVPPYVHSLDQLEEAFVWSR